VKPNFRALGRRFGKGTPAVAAAITSADAADLAGELRSGGTASVLADGAEVRLRPDDVIVTQTPRSGWAVASDGGETVALEVIITPELRREGLAREVVRLVQEARKNDGLHVSDRIALRWVTADQELAGALTEHGEMISAEILAVDYETGPAADAGAGAAAGTEHLAGASTEHVAGASTEHLAGASTEHLAGASTEHVAGTEHVDADLGLTFWIRRIDTADGEESGL
jgi:isoleucyl-tRNA synthetase